MNNDLLVSLLDQNKISESEYQTYFLFNVDENGRDYLAKACESILMEEPYELKNGHALWHDGRRSVWRHIKLTIYKVNKLMEKEQNDSNSGKF